jgi:hypothetical protein
MKLLREFVSFDRLQVIKEDFKDDSGVIQKTYKLKGPFLEASIKNKNGRVYPAVVLEREVKDFVTTKIKTRRSLGELDHPENPQINLERVSHVIEDLYMDGNTGYGVAKILTDTPMGKIAQALVKEGILLGMSTRGVGSLDGDTVQEDYKLITIDIVADPSAPNAFVEGVLESKEFEFTSNGDIVERAVANLRKSVDKSYDRLGESKKALCAMMNFLDEINQKI